MTGDFEAMALYAGQGLGKLNAIIPAAQRLNEIAAAARQHMADTAQPKDVASPASPVCYADEADDAYMGFASRDEVITFLNMLLEAERAGARITAKTATDSENTDLTALMKQVQGDEARWCAMLLDWIHRLDGEASPKVGDFYEKCLAYSDLLERAAFINRGQGWVVRKLREMLPKIRDNQMHADLTDMLTSHEANIAKTNDMLGA